MNRRAPPPAARRSPVARPAPAARPSPPESPAPAPPAPSSGLQPARARTGRTPLPRRTLDQLQVDDERALRRIPLYLRLRDALVSDGYRFRIVTPPAGPPGDYQRALLLNLVFFRPGDAPDAADVLPEERIAADVVAHAAWHHLAARALGPAAATADGLLLGEAIASAFDAYLVGRLLAVAPRAEFLRTQVPAMAEACASAGLAARGFEALLDGLARDPAAAFESLRALLFGVATDLVRAPDADAAARRLARADDHPFAPLLHHYQLASWLLYARAYAPAPAARVHPTVAAIDRALRRAPVALDWLAGRWLR